MQKYLLQVITFNVLYITVLVETKIQMANLEVTLWLICHVGILGGYFCVFC